jgi:hypothetical protein
MIQVKIEDMLGRHLRELEKLKAQYQSRLDSIHEADADPSIKAIYQSDLQYHIVKIEAEIQHEKDMLPFKYTLVGFVVAVLGLIIYSI